MPAVKNTVVGKGIKVLKAETYTKAGVMWWRFIIEKPMPMKAEGDNAPDGFGTVSYSLPGYTFEVRAAEYGLDDFEEVLELIFLETVTGFDTLDDANPYEEDEEVCRSKKRATVARVKKDHKVTWAPGVRAQFDAKVRFNPDNIQAYKEVEVQELRRRHKSNKAVIERQMVAAMADNDDIDLGGPITRAKDIKRELARRDGQRIKGDKVRLRGQGVVPLNGEGRVK
jgi:hypothetical protein